MSDQIHDTQVDPQWGLQVDETDHRQFRHGATGYGVEIYGGTTEARTAILRELFDEPLVTVDCRDYDTAEEVVSAALQSLGVDPTPIAPYIDLRRELGGTEYHFAIVEFDALDSDEQTNLAQTMKGVAEELPGRDTMLGYTCSQGGVVTRAESDLSARVRSWEVTPQNEEYDPLFPFSEGDTIKTSERKTPMEVQEISEQPSGNLRLIAENHHGEYELSSNSNGTIDMETSRGYSRNVEVDHVE